MFGRKQREIERLSEKCLEIGEQLKEKNKENEKLKKEIKGLIKENG